jgi:uncharacterized Zn ribbon protein
MEWKIMPWCPKCKSEYQDDVTVCPDCQVELVEELEKEVEMVPFIQAPEKEAIEKLIRYFEYSGLKCNVEYNEGNEEYELFVPKKQQSQAAKLYQAFLYVESEEKLNETAHTETAEEADEDGTATDAAEEVLKDEDTPEEPEDDAPEFNPDKDQGVYVMKADRYKDLKDTVWVFLLFGIVGLFVVILNATGIFTFINGALPNLVLGALFIFFIYVGLSTHKKAKQIQSEIDTENKLTEEINQWLKQNVTESFLSSLHDENLSAEVNYLKKADAIKDLLIKKFGNQNLAYLDRLIDEFYYSNFEENENTEEQ